MLFKSLCIFFIGIAFVQVRAENDAATFESLEGSGGDPNNPILSDDEDHDGFWSGSGDGEENYMTTAETEIETTANYEDEPEVVATTADTETDSGVVIHPDLKEEELENEVYEDDSKMEELEEEVEETGDDKAETEVEEKMDEDKEEKEDLETDVFDQSLPESKPEVIIPELTTTTKMISKETETPKSKDDKAEEEKDEMDVETDLAVKPVDQQPPAHSSLFDDNEFLIAIIVGGCIGLLFAICVILLVVYRLKKKDEGSYALEEQKKLASPSYQYTQGQEYFA